MKTCPNCNSRNLSGYIDGVDPFYAETICLTCGLKTIHTQIDLSVLNDERTARKMKPLKKLRKISAEKI